LDLEATNRFVRKPLGVAPGDLIVQFVVEARETALARTIPARDVELRRMRQVCRDERDPALAIATESRDAPSSRHRLPHRLADRIDVEDARTSACRSDHRNRAVLQPIDFVGLEGEIAED